MNRFTYDHGDFIVPTLPAYTATVQEFKSKYCEKGFVIQTYGVVLLSLVITLMFIAICCLSYILYRMRYGKYRNKTFLNLEVVPSSNEYVEQISNEVTEPVPLKKISTFDSPFKQSDILSMVDTDIKEVANSPDMKSQMPTTPNILDYKKQANGTKLNMHSVMTPDQMNKVCEEVLSKMKRNQSTSLTHLNELMNTKNNEEHTATQQSKFEDDFEEYDIVPIPKQVISNRGHDMDLYDCPKMGNEAIDSDDPQDYYDSVPNREDMYQNANFIHRML